MESNGHTTRGRWYRRDGSVRSRLRLALALGLLSALVLPGAAGATVGSVAMSGSVSPAPASATSTPVSLALSYDATYSSGFSPGVQRFTFQLDNDIAFDTVGISQCSLASINNATRAAALAACPGSVVGSGNTVWLGSGGTTLNGVIDAFNGQPSSGSPTIYLHDAIYNSVNQEAVDTTSAAVLSPSALGGDFGTQISFPWPPTGLGTTHLAVTLNNLEPTPGHHFWSAACGDADRTLNYAGDFTYNDATTRSATATQACESTGQRAAALKSCKKQAHKHDWSHKRLRKCKKKANLLPV